MNRDISQNFSPLEMLIANSPRYQNTKQPGRRNDPTQLFSYSLTHEKDTEKLYAIISKCKPWIAAYDNEQQTLYTQYNVDIINKLHLGLVFSPDTHINAFKFIAPNSLQESEYFLVPTTNKSQEGVVIYKNLPDGNYAIFALKRGLKEFVYNLTTNTPILPVICADSLTTHPHNGIKSLRIRMLIIENLDLHLEHSRKKIFLTMRRNIIDGYRVILSELNS